MGTHLCFSIMRTSQCVAMFAISEWRASPTVAMEPLCADALRRYLAGASTWPVRAEMLAGRRPVAVTGKLGRLRQLLVKCRRRPMVLLDAASSPPLVTGGECRRRRWAVRLRPRAQINTADAKCFHVWTVAEAVSTVLDKTFRNSCYFLCWKEVQV